MKTNIIFIALMLLSAVTFGQVSKQFIKIYEEDKFREVITLREKYISYASREDEMVIDDFVGRSYYALQIYDSTIYFEDKVLALDNDATLRSSWAYTYRGMALYRQGNKDQSIADLKKAIELDRSHNSVEVAKEFLGNVYDNSVPDDKYRLYFLHGEYKNAIEEGKKQLQKKEYKDVLETVGAAYYHIHNYDSAIYFERAVLAIDKDATSVSGWAHTYLGMALYSKKENGKAIEELTKAIALNKTNGSVHTAENFLDNIINGRTLPIDSLHQAIKNKLIGNDYRAAVDIALTFIANNPNDALAWDQLSIGYCWLHNYDSSLYSGQKALAVDNEQSIISCEVHYHMGIDRFMKNDRNAADAEFTAAINDHVNKNLKNKVRYARILTGLDDMYARWKTVETDNIIFHFQNKKDIDDVDALMEKYEKEYKNAYTVIPVTLPKKIDIFIWDRKSLGPRAEHSNTDLAYTESDYCLAHIVQDNTGTQQILHILGHWQKSE